MEVTTILTLKGKIKHASSTGNCQYVVSCRMWAKMLRTEELSAINIISLIKATRKANALRHRRIQNLRPALNVHVPFTPTSERNEVDRSSMLHQMMVKLENDIIGFLN